MMKDTYCLQWYLWHVYFMLHTGIFDAHDLWHFLSALGIFFMFMFILTLGKRLKHSQHYPWRMPLKLFYTFIKNYYYKPFVYRGLQFWTQGRNTHLLNSDFKGTVPGDGYFLEGLVESINKQGNSVGWSVFDPHTSKVG